MGWLVLAAVLLASCGSQLWRRDHGVVVLSPAALSTVRVPFVIRWSVAADRPSPRYAVFIDRAPVAPGHGLRDVADPLCRITPGCPDTAYLQGRGVYTTSVPSLTVSDLQPVGGIDGRTHHPVHTATIVRLDASGDRVGEASWSVEFHA
jgi:hypothetical protein